MKKIIILTVLLSLVFGLSGCALLDFLNSDSTTVDLGGEEYVRWNLVWNNNEYRQVESAYFEFNKDSFKYYENGELKKEGSQRITYFGLENTISPLHINLDFGKKDGFSVYDYLDCYTEDEESNLHQFTIISEGYHIKTDRSGGVPVRDYHLSNMPYAFGTYVKENTQQYSYVNGKANYLNCAYLDGTFCDESGNKFYFANNAYSSDDQSVSYDIYMRYENKVNGTSIEGNIKLSWYEDLDTKEKHNVALLYVTHGENEPGKESGTLVFADYQLMDFNLSENSFSFVSADYFDENRECDYNPANFLGGTYNKVNQQ